MYDLALMFADKSDKKCIAKLHYCIGLTQKYLYKYDQSLLSFNKAVLMNGSFVNAIMQKCLLLQNDLFQYAQAFNCYNQIISNNPYNKQVLLN